MTWFGPVINPGAQTLGVMTPEVRDRMFAVLEETIEVLSNDVAQAYADGESSGYADWIAAVDDHLPADTDVTPADVGRYVRLLQRECDVLAQALVRVGAYPVNYPRTADGIRDWAHAHAVAGTTIDKDGD